jgi:hypothetical protein
MSLGTVSGISAVVGNCRTVNNRTRPRYQGRVFFVAAVDLPQRGPAKGGLCNWLQGRVRPIALAAGLPSMEDYSVTKIKILGLAIGVSFLVFGIGSIAEAMPMAAPLGAVEVSTGAVAQQVSVARRTARRTTRRVARRY